jgi:hypothetical protein
VVLNVDLYSSETILESHAQMQEEAAAAAAAAQRQADQETAQQAAMQQGLVTAYAEQVERK